METINSQTRWSLNNLLYGFDLEKLSNHINSIKEKLTDLETYSRSNSLKENELLTLSKIIKQIESVESFYYCLTTENVEPSLLTSINGSISTLKSQVRSILSHLQETLNKMSDKEFDEWANSINEKQLITDIFKGKRVSKEEKNRSSFARETLSCMQEVYEQIRNNLEVRMNLGDGEKELTFGEANHLAMSHSDSSKRPFIFKELNHSLEKQANVFASIYNQMVGLRLNENRIRNVHYLDESLKLNGISSTTLNAMWDAVDCKSKELSEFLKIKANDAEKDKLTWHELMSTPEDVSLKFTFSQAIEGIIKSLQTIDSNISEYIKEVITKGWVDAEQRKTKPFGGFCAPFLAEGQSRISLSYDNSIDSARRLAHELGHAWHFQQMKAAPSLRFSEETFEMTMAETSSIFFETAFIDYVIEDTQDESIKKAILGWKIERGLNYLMSIRRAFLFENAFYECRKNGQIDVKQMENLSLQSQEKAFGNGLSEYEPYVWIKYGQFYQADVPFYNYPYSFGFLLSIGLLEISKGNGDFCKKFQEFLSETGMLPLEQLIKKHFNLDLTQPEFWQRSILSLIKDINQYKNLGSE
ncbi:peptidase M3 [Metabacillus idriensis]|uniref:Peptidase M3 n=1 Tax=Metabacillus idriensis TaxID=324768 RepID=A0A6I2MG47_9BACI|nr:M3 family metallopeptidase [Metabacillus idriensis]MCM3596137.1 peptidase M3 [Metabacillus idriensis]MRX56112.1 peptidase M3 [Metabacillus idriensis]